MRVITYQGIVMNYTRYYYVFMVFIYTSEIGTI